ncbi:hypothetical protein COO91_10647 (plasmid) [Nostoc flagelliforme CCNUN1]|uniref:Uncharacterized protein n=1 Tax=Nostoc flagelliforme CCNUN1 TaxID=2038116 RepID=A0A2K8T9Q4_9NOSO|nr:hypothetical protein COO91_10647 [Nostoc flagelliforme CCNUN1]
MPKILLIRFSSAQKGGFPHERLHQARRGWAFYFLEVP